MLSVNAIGLRVSISFSVFLSTPNNLTQPSFNRVVLKIWTENFGMIAETYRNKSGKKKKDKTQSMSFTHMKMADSIIGNVLKYDQKLNKVIIIYVEIKFKVLTSPHKPDNGTFGIFSSSMLLLHFQTEVAIFYGVTGRDYNTMVKEWSLKC